MKQSHKEEVVKRLKDFLGEERWIKSIRPKDKREEITDSSISSLMNVSNSQFFPKNTKQEKIRL